MRVAKYALYDILRTRFVLGYTLFLLIITFSLFSLDSDAGKASLSLLNIILLVVPLLSVIFTTIHFFNSYEFIELLLAQPIKRSTIFLNEYVAVSISLSMSFLIGVGFPLCLLYPEPSSFFLLIAGILLTCVFVSLGFLASVITRDKAKGIGISLLFWFYFALIYDGFLLYIIYSFSDYPLEKVTLVLTSLNPIDLARISILLKLDISALMGYTGAFYQDFFGTYIGLAYSFTLLLFWISLPLFVAYKIFLGKDI